MSPEEPISVKSQTAMSVLIVDDEPGMRSFLTKALSKKFALVETASTIAQAESIRSQGHFDLLIVDIRFGH